jgi:DNA repair protein RecO (recombination protein O)
MIRKTRGIVLHTTRYGDSSLVVHCYTEQHGRQTYMVKGVRESRKDNRSNLFQPFFILDFEVYHKDTREIQLVKEVNRSVPLNTIPYDITKSTQAIFLAEVLFRVVKEEEPNPILAHFLINSIEYLDTLGDPDPDYHIIFLFHLSRHLGFYPQNNFSEINPCFDLVKGQFVSGISDPEMQLDGATSRLWSNYLKADFQISRKPGFSSSQRKSVLDQLIRYYKYHVEGMGDIRSLDVLHEFFHNL